MMTLNEMRKLPHGIFETTPIASRTYTCDGYRCGGPIQKGERYRRATMAPWYSYNEGGRRLQDDGTWKDVAWFAYHLHLDGDCQP